MGGVGSGRPPSVETIIARERGPPQTPIGSDIWLPNYSGLKDAARKTSTASLGGGHTIQNEGSSLSARTYLNFSGSNVVAYDDSVNDATVVSISGTGGSETDPIFMALSGSLPYLTAYTETDPIFMSLSGSLPYAPTSKGVTNGDSHDHNGGDGAQINHTTLSNIGTNTHAQIDTHIADTSDPHGSILTQTQINLTHLSGSTGVLTSTLSGSKFVVTGDFSTSGSAYVANAIFGTDATPPTASNFPIGTIYYQYTP